MRRPDGEGEQVTCPACGRQVDRSEAREYDRFGDPGGRRHRSLEYLCRTCHAELTHVPRDELEAILVDANAGGCDRETFLRRYNRAVWGRRGRHGER